MGTGTIGSRYVTYLRGAGHDVVTVDRREPADSPDVRDLRPRLRPDAWIVATPTSTHLTVLRQILGADPAARVLLEKPACSAGEIQALSGVREEHPRARVMVNDVYAHSQAVRLFARAVRAGGRPEDIASVTVEFTKNRRLDEARGRFTDPGYGEVGYEWFHLMTLLRSVLPPRAYAAYLTTARPGPPPDLRVDTRGEKLPHIRLHASMRGAIAFADAAGFAFAGLGAQRQLARGAIPYGSSFRYRFAQVGFHSGVRVTLAFESGFGLVPDHKNSHSVHIGGGLAERSFRIVGNQLREALFAQLEVLLAGDGGMAELRIPEHRHMDALAREIKRLEHLDKPGNPDPGHSGPGHCERLTTTPA
ncbi:hypothetical protein [Streptomyces sp. NPDC046805]|uniref:hypothetical protein n=1 Tax=Streptomyces sp. NPDC046805 TaxID=3155134 RepID=UPI0033CC6E86